ncbi:hypothetical protein PS627_03536 [Pseudomonas fluorescens]|uniref:DUF3426 domain-containing protein n=1 Tax=Pseudomonas fluorescens TaxID=294 RepID=UPI00125415C0|nr:DUF3426 domain-containing protein [Pseudomonas fluorescens]CAG8869463.1 hypothetical protein PS627_03536 [Pseudomonas fluorescens]VVP95326.1 hypothetical protein PS910_03284 [Pseudomonas fluorescens]
MTDSFVTQCPHCQTSFRVTHHQLSLARGVVRCGACLQVFNAAKQLLEQSGAANAVPAPEAVLAPSADSHPQPQAQPQHRDSTEQSLDDLDLDQELARLERRGGVRDRRAEAADERLHARRDEPDMDESDDANTPFGTARDAQPEPDLPEEPAPPLIVEQADEPEQEAGDRTEPSLSNLDLNADDEPQVDHRDRARITEPYELSEPSDDERSQDRLSARDDEEAGEHFSARDGHDALLDEPEERLEPGLVANVERPGRKEPLIDLVDDPLQLDWQKPRTNWRKRLVWGALVLLAAGLLGFQYLWFHFDELARHDRYRPWFQQLCPAVGCTVPTRVDIARIKSSNLVVRSHPDFKGALIVDAIIYNRAPFAQPFPSLELRFSDLNGQLIASRRFKPAEYLSGELAGRGEMPSQTPIHIALDILDPGPKAVNYSLSFRSPE